MAKRKNKSEDHKSAINQRWERSEKARQLSLFSEKSNSTHQFPAGNHTIIDDTDVTPFDMAVYYCINKFSNWDTGRSHALSHRDIANKLNVKHPSQVAASIRKLKKQEWLEHLGTRKKNEPGAQAKNAYRVIHHKPPEGEDTPIDRDGRPLKCAIPDSIWDELEQGKKTWRHLHVFYISKLKSNWGDGTLETSLGSLAKLCRFNREKLKECLENLGGMIRKIGSFLYELLPPPSKPKKERKEREALGRVKLLNGFYHSLDRKWRLQESTCRLEMKRGHNYWVDADWYDLRNINKSIYDDFRQLSSMYSELDQLRENLESI